MPNGFHGSEEKWQQIEFPLRSLDDVLLSYAQKFRMTLSSNYHNWPERSLKWGSPTRCLIQIYLENEKDKTYDFWICASEDRGGNRYWKNVFLKWAVPLSDIQQNILQLLNSGREQLEQWQSQDLELATNMAK